MPPELAKRPLVTHTPTNMTVIVTQRRVPGSQRPERLSAPPSSAASATGLMMRSHATVPCRSGLVFIYFFLLLVFLLLSCSAFLSFCFFLTCSNSALDDATYCCDWPRERLPRSRAVDADNLSTSDTLSLALLSRRRRLHQLNRCRL